MKPSWHSWPPKDLNLRWGPCVQKIWSTTESGKKEKNKKTKEEEKGETPKD